MSRLGDFISRNRPVIRSAEKVKLLEVKSAGYDSAYRHSPWWFTQEGYLSELDSRSIAFLARMSSNQILVNPFGQSGSEPTEMDRLAVVQWARHWAVYDPLIKCAIRLTTDYGFGQEVGVIASDTEQAVWDTFWNSPDNRRILGSRFIDALSRKLLTDGEEFFVFWVKLNGEVTMRLFPTEQIKEIITDPEDQDTPLYYKRVRYVNGEPKEVFYPDWLASSDMLAKAKLPDNAVLSDSLQEGLRPVIMHVALDEVDGRGWPLSTASEPWAKAYKQFATDRAAVGRAAASVLEEYQIDGGSRMVSDLQSQLQSSLNTTGQTMESNPPPGAGSTRVINNAVKTRRMNMTTGASDAQIDSLMLLGQTAVGMSLTPLLLGRTDSAQNRAIAEVAMRPTLRSWERYKNMWRSVFEDIFTLVCDAAVDAKKLKPNYDRGVIVTLSSAIDVDFDVMVGALERLWDKGIFDRKTITSLALRLPALNLSQDAIEGVLTTMYGDETTPDTDATPEEEPDENLAQEMHDLLMYLELQRMEND